MLTTQDATTRRRAMSGSLWTILGYGGGSVVRLASNVVLTHLLFPRAFGLMLLVNLFMQGMVMFSDIGIGPSIIHHKRGDDQRFLDTAWTIQVLRGVLMCIAAIAAAPLMAWYFEEPELTKLIPVAGLSAVIAGFNSTKLFTTNRHLLIGRRTLILFAAQCAGVAVMVLWAWVHQSVWALVAGGIATSVVQMVLSHTALPGPNNHFHLDPTARSELIAFGKWIFTSTVITFFASQADRVLLAKLVSLDRLGVFGVAANLVSLPSMLVATLAGTVAFPLLAARAREVPGSLQESVLRGRSQLMPACLFMVAGMALLAPAFFRTFYDARYAEAGQLTVLLTLQVWISCLSASADRTLLALGDARALAISNAASVIGKVVGCLGGFRLGGLEGFILGSALGPLAGHLVVVNALSRKGISIWRQDLKLSLICVVCVGVGLAIQPAGMLDRESARSPLLDTAIMLGVLFPCGFWAWRRLRAALANR